MTQLLLYVHFAYLISLVMSPQIAAICMYESWRELIALKHVLHYIFSALLLKAILSIRPSVCHTRNPRLDGSRYRNTFHIIQQSDDFSFSMPNFIVLTGFRGFILNNCVKERHPPIESENVTNI